MANHLHRPGHKKPKPLDLAILDCPGDVLESYLAATSKAFADAGPGVTQVDIQTRLMKAAADIGVTGDHAKHLAMRYSLFISIITGHQAELRRRGLMTGEAGPGKATTFTIPFLAAVARIPARVSGDKPVCDMTAFWALCDACSAAFAKASEPKPA